MKHCIFWSALVLYLVSAQLARVYADNEPARRLYEELGFEARGIRRGYYTDNREDALIMWRDARG